MRWLTLPSSNIPRELKQCYLLSFTDMVSLYPKLYILTILICCCFYMYVVWIQISSRKRVKINLRLVSQSSSNNSVWTKMYICQPKTILTYCPGGPKRWKCHESMSRDRDTWYVMSHLYISHYEVFGTSLMSYDINGGP